MKSLPVAFVLIVGILIGCHAQQVSEVFNPIIKERPSLVNIVQHKDGNYLIFGVINYYADEQSGSLVKVDGTGKRLTDFQMVTTDRIIDKVIVLPNGKILIQGAFTQLNGKRTGPIARLNEDGSVDPAFQIDHNLVVRDFVAQSTGKIIINSSSGTNSIVYRLNEDGTRDNSFVDPIVGNKFWTLLDDNDKIYVGNSTVVYRLTPNGTLDNSYTFVSEPSKTIGGLARQDDGKIIAIISEQITTPAYSTRHTLQRYNLDGSIDNSFLAGQADQRINACIIREDGKVLIAGIFETFDSKPGSVMELNADGSTNRAILTTDRVINTMYRDRNQNTFVTGLFAKANGIESIKVIAKLNANNELDPAFKVPVTGAAIGLPIVVATQSDGKVLAGGSIDFVGVGSDSSKVVRMLPDGRVDRSFQPAINNVSTNLGFTIVNAIAVQPDDKVLLGGNGLFKGPSPSLGRLLPNGQLDPTFQIGNGVYLNNWPGTVRNMLIEGSKIYVLGDFNKFNGTACQSLAILNESGQMIGPQQHVVPANSFILDIGIQSNGKIILAGGFNLSPSDYRKFIRLNSDGSIDNSFTLKTVDGNITDIEIDNDDNIIVTGSMLDLNSEMILKRFKPDGEIDPSFNLGSGFKGYKLMTAYFAKALENNLLAVGGYFSSYRGVSSPSIVILTKDGGLVSMTNPFDSVSGAIGAVYANNILYMRGRFSKKNETYSSGAKVVFPIGETPSNYNVIAVSDSSMLVSWEGKFGGADRIVVEKSSTDASSFTVAATLVPNINSYELRQLNEVELYHVRIKGVNEFYSTAYLSGKDTTHIAPQIALPASDVTPSSFVANWKYIPGTDSCVIQVSDNSFARFLNGYENLVVKSGSLSIGGLEEGATYQYRVRRFKNGKSSAFSSVIAVNVITALEEENPLSVSVYPNPLADQLVIELPENLRDAKVFIHTMNGNLVGEYVVEKGSSMINAERFPTGMFIMTVYSQGKSRKFKLVRTTERL